jgi:hypothetical protein
MGGIDDSFDGGVPLRIAHLFLIFHYNYCVGRIIPLVRVLLHYYSGRTTKYACKRLIYKGIIPDSLTQNVSQK